MQLMRRYWTILSPFHRTFGTFLILLFVLEGLQVFESYTMSLVIKLFGAQADPRIWIGFFTFLLILDEVFMRLDNAADWHIVMRHSFAVNRYLKLGSIYKFLEMDLPWHQKHNSGTLVGKVIDGVKKVNDIMDGLSWEFIPTFIQVILSLIPLAFISPWAVVIALSSFGIFLKLVLGNHAERRPLRAERQNLYEEEWHKANEMVQSFETSLMFGQQKRLIREHQKLHNRIVKLGEKEMDRGIYFFGRWQIRTITFARRLIWAVWVYQMYNGSLDIPTLVFANSLLERLTHSFWRFSRLIDRASEAAEGAARLAGLLEEKPNRPYDGTITEPVEFPLGIELDNVQFAYTEEYTAINGGLHDLSIQIPGGSVVALVGPSGAGKTTIQKVIAGMIRIHGGSIRVGGVDVRDWESESLLDQFSFVPQGDSVYLFNGTVRENIAFARPESSESQIRRAAELAGIHEFITHLEEGYDTIVGERGKRLSGGQKQRVALARAILADRPILILDEATSAVDAITEEEIQSKMRTILAGKTAIIIAHRLSTIWDIADKIVVLDHGRKVEEGTHEELVSRGGLYATMVALQTKQ